jgi:asparagine synthase (glutamine-hydrolysing)
MGATVAVVNKKNGNAVATVVTMLKAISRPGNEAYAVGTSNATEIAQDFTELKKVSTQSAAAIGYIFNRILQSDKPQPIKSQSSVIFDGRIYSLQKKQESDASVFSSQMRGNVEKAAESFVRHRNGDFVFVVAQKARIIAGRDPLGVRSFYYGENTEIAAVSSERRALWRIGVREVESFPPGQVAVVGKTGFRFTEIRSLNEVKTASLDTKKAVHELAGLLRLSVRRRISGLKRVAVAFSGGLDSSIIALLAKRENANVHLIHVSLENRDETKHAMEMAELLALPIHAYCYDEDDVDQVLNEIPDIVEKADPLNISVGIPVYWTAKRAAKLKLNVMFAGQGADELFGGYKRYQDFYLQYGKVEAEEEIRRDILAMHEINFERDSKICNSQNVELRLPFADYDVARFAFSLPLELKLERRSESLRKVVLRKTAESIGLPRLVVSRPKKAIQYATGINGVLLRKAKREKLSLRDYLNKLFSHSPGRG